MNLKDKTCLITGGTKGIGAATAEALANRGARIGINGRHEDRESEALLTRLRKRNTSSALITADLSQPDEPLRLVEVCSRDLGAPDVLIHCAGAPVPGGILSVSPECWYAAFDLHVHAIYHLCRAAVPRMREKGAGAIVLISSAAGLRGCLNSAAYSVVKGALPQFARSLARELADDNIRVNCVAPGVIRTRFQDHLTASHVANNLENRIPLHREGKPEDVAELIVTLITNDYITGETVSIDGGLTMRIA